MQESPDRGRGVDLELYDARGARYAITITASGVYWYEGVVRGTAYLPFDGFLVGAPAAGRVATPR